MTKSIVALALLVSLAAAVAGCGDDDTAPSAPATTASTSSARPAPAAAPVPAGARAGLRAQSCRDILPMLDQLRALDPAAAAQTAETTIANLASTPEWAGLSEADRAATIAGIRDAAAGSCL